MGVIRRGLVNTATSTINVSLDAAVISTVLEPHVANTDNPHDTTTAQLGAVPAVRALAVVSTHAGVRRAFLPDAWHWHSRTLGRILGLASLRG